MKRIERNHWSELVAAGTEYLAELAELGEHVEYGSSTTGFAEDFSTWATPASAINWAGSWETSPEPQCVSTA
jgi:hypothetical protein